MAKVAMVPGTAGKPVPTILCPGCRGMHHLNPPENPNSKGARWTWNGSWDKPTFSPSINSRVGPWPEEFRESREAKGLGVFDVCHAFVQEGRIQFLSDCTHALAGQTVDLPEWPESQVS